MPVLRMILANHEFVNIASVHNVHLGTSEVDYVMSSNIRMAAQKKVVFVPIVHFSV